MNIFALSDSPVQSAVLQHDKHVVKMTLESAQLISTCIRIHADFWFERLSDDDQRRLYRITHRNHPCCKWARETHGNFAWLCVHGKALAREYTYRYGRTHKSEAIIDIGLDFSKTLEPQQLTPFAMAMPDQYKTDDPVLSYRLYYIAEKIQDNSTWTNRRADLPDWLFRHAL